MALNSTIFAGISATLTGSPDLGSTKHQISAQPLATLANGVGNNQADKLFDDTRTLAASASESLDLAGVLIDPFGATLTFAKIKAIYIAAAAGNTNNVVVGDAASPFLGPFGAAAHTLAVPPGGAIMLAAPKSGWTVTASSADLLKVANSGSGTPVTYNIVLIGTSA